MPDAGLKITVSADVAAAMKGFSTLTGAIEATEKEVSSISQALQRVSAEAPEEEFDKLAASLKEANDRLKTLTDQLKKPLSAPAIPSGNPASALTNQLKEVPKAAKDAEDGLKDLNEQSDASGKGFLGLGLNSSQLRVAFLDLGRVITGQGFNLRSLASNFTLLGPGLAIAAAAAYGLFEVLTRQTDAQKKAIEAQKEYKAALDEVSKSVGDQAAKATTLVNALESGSLNIEQRKKALKELTDINVEYFGGLKDEKGIIDGLSLAYDLYIKKLNSLGIEKAIEGQLSKLFDKKLELQLQIDPKFNAAIDPVTQQELGKLQRQLQSLGGPIDVSSLKNQSVLDIQDNATLKQRIDLQQRISTIEQGSVFIKDKAYQADKKALDVVNQQIEGLSKLQQDNGVFDIKDSSQKGPKVTDDLLKQIEEAQKALDKLNTRPLFIQLRDSLADDSLNGVAVLQKQLADGIAKAAKIGTPQAAKEISTLAELINKEIANIKSPNLLSNVDFTLANPADASKAFDKINSEVEKQFGKQIKLEAPAQLKLDIENSGISDEDKKILVTKIENDAKNNLPTIQFVPKIKSVVDAKVIADATLEQLNKSVSLIERGIAASGLEAIGTAIGDALSGKGFSKAIDGFVNTLGEGLIEVGKELVLTSSIIKGIKSALSDLFEDPVVGIAVGIGAIAVGEILKNSVSNVGAHAFATGGIVTGPTLGLVGEAGPEVIFPLSQLNRFVKNTQGSGGAQTVQITGRLSGNDLKLVLARSNKNQALV